jgi:uncharacterized membrane protein YfcA
MSGIELILAIGAMALGAALQGSIGFGQNLVAAPMVALIQPAAIPGGLLTASLFMNSLILLRERNDFDLGEVSWALVGRVPGVVIGAFAVTALSRDGLGLALGVVVLFAALANVAGFQIARTPINKFGAGLLSGVGATAVGIGGPPVAMLYADVEGKQLRATMSVFMMLGTVISVLALAAFGEYGAQEFKLGLHLVPGVFVGFAASSKLGPILDRGYIRPLVIGVSIVSAVAVLVKSLA